jgi:rSAM/selenodomain-associated transferase 1
MTTEDAKPVVLAMLKVPRAGEVKTRLARDVGAHEAVVIYRRLVEHQMRAIPADWKIEVHYAPADGDGEIQEWLGQRPAFFSQLGEHLGERLAHATAGAFSRGAERLVVIGGDCPGLDEATLRTASRALKSVDVVLGPADDGGYYLIGLKRSTPEIFERIAWSSDTVLESTLERVRERGLSHVLLNRKGDVDDLPGWRRLEALLGPALVSPPPAK